MGRQTNRGLLLNIDSDFLVGPNFKWIPVQAQIEPRPSADFLEIQPSESSLDFILIYFFGNHLDRFHVLIRLHDNILRPKYNCEGDRLHGVVRISMNFRCLPFW
jgi:hypothetical protein